MWRYLRLYAYFLRFSFSRAMEFRLDFFFRVVMDVVYYAVNLAFFGVIYGHTDLMGGWNFDQILIFATGFFLVDALNMTLFSNNLWLLPFHINQGQLDYYLVRPVSTLYFVSLREFAANSFLNLLIAAGLLVWAMLRYPPGLDPARALAYILLLANGAFLQYILNMCFLIPVFWLHRGRGLGDVFMQVHAYAERPERIFTGAVRLALVTILPLALIVSVPADIAFGYAGGQAWAHVAGVTTTAFLAMRWFWGRGLRAYASASS